MYDDPFDDWGWEDMAMAGFLAEEMADEERERVLLELDEERDSEDELF